MTPGDIGVLIVSPPESLVLDVIGLQPHFSLRDGFSHSIAQCRVWADLCEPDLGS